MLGYLIDMDGVIYRGGQLIPGADRFVNGLREANIPFLFLTNNTSKSRHQYAEKITALGMPTPDEKVFTSGEATALYLARLLKPTGVRVSRIAQGVPMGGDLEYADQVTLARALAGRREL